MSPPKLSNLFIAKDHWCRLCLDDKQTSIENNTTIPCFWQRTVLLMRGTCGYVDNALASRFIQVQRPSTAPTKTVLVWGQGWLYWTQGTSWELLLCIWMMEVSTSQLTNLPLIECGQCSRWSHHVSLMLQPFRHLAPSLERHEMEHSMAAAAGTAVFILCTGWMEWWWPPVDLMLSGDLEIRTT